MRGKLAVELGEQGDAIGDAKLGAGGGQCRVLSRGGAVDDEARPRQRLERRHERGIADPVVRPGNAPAQRQHGVGVDRQNAVEARAQLAPGVGRVAGGESKPKAVRDGVGLGVGGRVEALRLDCGVGRDAAVGRPEAVAALEPPAVALRVKLAVRWSSTTKRSVDIQ